MHLFLLIIGVIFGLVVMMNVASLLGVGRQSKNPSVTFLATSIFAAISVTGFYFGIG